MNTIKLDTHTVIPELFTKDGWALDVGCRGFHFTELLANYGMKVIGLDPDLTIVDPKKPSITYVQKALIHTDKESLLYASWSTGEGNFVTPNDQDIPHYAKKSVVYCTSIERLMKAYGIAVFDIVKLDCEGSEYEILAHWPGPIAKQISAEYHDFTGYAKDKLDYYHKTIDAVLGKWYDTVQHNQTHLLDNPKAPINYWDSVYVLKPEFLHTL